MVKQKSLLFCLVLISAVTADAQNSSAGRADIFYEIKADSLSLKNIPQDLNLSVSSAANEKIEVYQLTLEGKKDVLWTVVSAEMNKQPVWLINSDAKSERDDILAWTYDQKTNSLRFYPPGNAQTYELDIMLRMNLLRPQSIAKKSSKELILAARTGGQLLPCSTKGRGNTIAFR